MSGIGSESAFESSKYTIWEGAAIRCLCLSTTSNKLTPHTQKFPNQQCQKHPYAPVLCVQSVREDLHEKSVKAILTVEEPVLNNAYCSGKGSVASKSLFLQNHLTLAQTFRKKRQICQAQKQRGGNATNFPLWTFLTQFFDSTMPITVNVQSLGFCMWHNCHPLETDVSTRWPGLRAYLSPTEKLWKAWVSSWSMFSPMVPVHTIKIQSAQPIPYAHVVTILKALCKTAILLNLRRLGGREVGNMIVISVKEQTRRRLYI